MTAAFVVFGGLGAALTGLIALLIPPRPGLLASIGRLDAARTAAPQAQRADADPTAGRQAQLGRLVAARLGSLARPGRTDPRGSAGHLDAGLAVTERAADAHLGRKVLVALYGFLLLPGAALALVPVGVHLPATALLIGAPALAAGFFVLPDLELRGQAEARRREFRRALRATWIWSR